jgi:formylglycine-generating enzyme required for sulfatase activity
MKRRLQHPLSWGAAAVIAAAFGLLAVQSPAPSQAPAKLPLVGPRTHKNYVQKVDDKVSFEMVAIPGGTYLMGSPPTEKGHQPDESPQHPVTVKPFWMAKLEIPWDVYDIYWENRPKGPPPRPDISKKPEKLPDAITSPTPPYTDPTFGYGREGHPAIGMTYHAAMEFCRWLSKKTGKQYRLPTEGEWEWACRAGTTTAYSFGDDPAKLGEYAWFEGNSEEMPHKIGKKQPNPWGLYDMHGNVAEWCIDQYRKDFYSTASKEKAVLLPVSMPGDTRYPYVARGGSWIDPPEKLRSAARRHSSKEWLKLDPQNPQSIWWMTSADFVGFRVICPVEDEPRLANIRSRVTWWSENDPR